MTDKLGKQEVENKMELKPRKKEKKKKKSLNEMSTGKNPVQADDSVVQDDSKDHTKELVKEKLDNSKTTLSKIQILKQQAEQKRKQDEEIKAAINKSKEGDSKRSKQRKPLSKIQLLKQQAEQKRKQEEEIKAAMELLKIQNESIRQPEKQVIQESNSISDLKTTQYDSLRRFRMANQKVTTEKKTNSAEKIIETEKKSDYFYKAPIVCILGHVDTGKTKILDKLRESNVQGNEAGGITQQIGATFFPYRELVKKTNTQFDLNNDVPGLLVIDTPGHETFSNLRSRGSSMCDFAILVVDILHALEKQTLESIELLKKKKTPFAIALNKIDRIFQWKSAKQVFSHFDIEKQSQTSQKEFRQRLDEIVVKFAEIGLNVRLFNENPDERKFINVIPTSAITGEGLSDLVNKIIDLSSKYMKNKITYKEKMEATVLEVKNVEGIGVTIDAIVSNGTLSENDKIVICGSDGPISTIVKSLLVPEHLKELRVKSTYKHLKTVKASLGIKIAAADLEKAIAGSRILKVSNYENEEEAKKRVMEDIHDLVDLDKIGIHLQASSLGSLEALIALGKDEKIPIASIGIGKNISRRDIYKLKAIKEKDCTVGIMLCFDTKVDKEMLELAETQHVKVFEAEIIYNLIDRYKEHITSIIQKNKKKTQHELIYPCMCQIIPSYIFTKRSPLVVGVEILDGKLKVNMPLYVKNNDNILHVGKVTSIILDKKNIEVANKGDKVSIKIETTDTPKLIGRDIKTDDIFYSALTRRAIDVLKEFYKDEITQDAWRLVIEIKGHLGIV